MKELMQTQKAKIICLLACLVLLAGTCIYYIFQENAARKSLADFADEDILEFEEDSCFFEDAATIHIRKAAGIPDSAQIFYTINDDRPDDTCREYEDGIVIRETNNEPTMYSVKAVLKYNGEYSDVYEHTYIVGEEAADHYGLPVVNISTDYASLYDKDDGIFENWNERSDEWIRAAHVTMLDTDGSLLLEQDTGLMVQGGTSGQFDIKSLKIIANETYDSDHDSFEVDFFRDGLTDSSWSLVNKYHQLKLRSGSQDRYYTNIRSALISRLCSESGFDGCTGTYRCSVYLNGQFYGIFDMQEQYSRSFLAKHFNLKDSSKVVTVKANEPICFEYTDVSQYFESDLNFSENRRALEEHVDMDNYLLYYAIEILANNTDWPGNNLMVWYYDGEKEPSNPYTDGRLRFLLFDTDLCYFYDADKRVFSWGNGKDILELLMTGIGRGEDSSFYNVMRCKYYRDRFVSIVCDLLNSSFEEENILQIAQEEYDRIRPEILEEYGEDRADSMDKYFGYLQYAIQNREPSLRENIRKYLSYTDTYQLSMSAGTGCMISWDAENLLAGDTWNGTYYCTAGLTLKAKAYDGYEFSHWLVNGEIVTGDTLELYGSMTADGLCQVEAVAEPIPEGCLQIAEFSAKGDTDWIRLTNVGSASIKASDYYISDDDEELLKFQLPDVLLEPGESILIDGKNNSYQLGDYQCNFSLNDTETVYLTEFATGNITEQIAVPNLCRDESYGHYLGSPLMKFFDNTDNCRYSS